MPEPISKQQVFFEALKMLGGWSRLLRTIGMLCLAGFCFFMPIPGSYELWLVTQVRTWPEVPIRLDSVEKEQSSFSKGTQSWRYRLTDIETGKTFATGDVEPGDIPFSAAGWSSADTVAAAYRAEVGQTIRVRRSPDGQRYFLRPGDPLTMSISLAISAAFWVWVFLNRRRVRDERTRLG